MDVVSKREYGERKMAQSIGLLGTVWQGIPGNQEEKPHVTLSSTFETNQLRSSEWKDLACVVPSALA